MTSATDTQTASTTTTSLSPALLASISAFGVPTAPKCSQPDSVLEDQLNALLDEAQHLSDYLGDSAARANVNSAVKIATLHVWSSSTNGPVEDAMARGLVPPYATCERVQDFPSPYPGQSNEDTFVELRQTLAQLGAYWDDGKRVVLIQDEDQASAIALRITSTSTLPSRPSTSPPLPSSAPLFLILFQHSTRAAPSSSSVRFLKRHRLKDVNSTIPQIVSSVAEQQLFLRLLRRNKEVFGGDVLNGLVTREQGEDAFEVGVLVPMYPISLDTIAEFGNELCGGCVLCGQAGSSLSRCAQCHAVSYCSPACQKEDWKHHKKFCKSLQGGKWVALPIPRPAEDASSSASSQPPLNVHASWPFIVQIMDTTPTSTSTSGPSSRDASNKETQPVTSVHISDRSQSLNFSITSSNNSANAIDSETLTSLFDTVTDARPTEQDQPAKAKIEEVTEEEAAILEPESEKNDDKEEGAEAKRKVYRWARRTGEWTVEVCVDRVVEGEFLGEGW